MTVNKPQWITLIILICATTLCSGCCIVPIAIGSLSYEPAYSEIQEESRSVTEDFAVNSRELWINLKSLLGGSISWTVTGICGATIALWVAAVILGIAQLFRK